MLRTVVVALIALFVLPAGAAGQTPHIDRGKKVYAAEKCSVCHSIAGEGNKRGALDEVGSRLSAEEIRQWMLTPAEMAAKTKSTRKPVMRAYPNLPKEDLDALVAYMVSLKKP